MRFASRACARKVAIDLRQNGGGDFNLGLQYLVRPLQQELSINQKGHLFVLIGPGTFSPAMSNASQFRTMTHAILVGEPIGERPNTFQEPREFTLPNSRWVVRYATRFYKFATGTENIIVPDKQIEQTWPDYKAGREDALKWILEQK